MSMIMAALIAFTPVSTAPPPRFLGPHLEARRYDNLRRHQQRMARNARARRAALTPYQRRCAARYRSYDPATGRYRVRPGVTARCRL